MKSPLVFLGVVGTHLRPRRTLVIILITLLGVLIFSFSRLVAFANLFQLFRPHAGTRITQLEIALEHNTTTPDPRTPVVPKIIHQIFHNWKDPRDNTLPAHWQAARDTCIKLNPDWEIKVRRPSGAKQKMRSAADAFPAIKLWTLEDSRTFIEDEYPWFLETYDSYKFPIQRIDVLRYFMLRYYGGIYLDLDNGCAEKLDALTYIPAFTTDGDRGTLSNNIMGGQPDHPYWHLLTENLIPYKWNWILPYVIISYQSGQWFVTAIWEKYHSLLSSDGIVDGFDGNGYEPLHRVLMDGRPDTDPWVFFTQTRGGTWSNWDSNLFNWIGEHIVMIILGLFVLVGLAFWGCTVCIRRRNSRGYQALPRAEMGEVAP
ncbi:hypothetical protein DL770_004881 [Monosporascus sp. CRB-9-2]|nr:hypothetical protein DL770_004881 [Monosporascus sp. CRB-9-2]